MSEHQEAFRSVLFEGDEADAPALSMEAPSCFIDLNLDQIIESLTLERAQYDLKPFFYTALTSIDAVTYRHEVMRDLDDDTIRDQVEHFASAMTRMRERLAQAKKLGDPLQRQFWLLAAHQDYHDALRGLAEGLEGDSLVSVGMTGFRDFLRAYVHGAEFATVTSEADDVESALDTIQYNVHLDGNKVTVTTYDQEADYSAAVGETFAKFRQGDVCGHLVNYKTYLYMNHVESNILALVAQLNPDAFDALDTYVRVHVDYVDQVVARFDREVQFYLGYIELARRMKAAGLSICYPTVSSSKAVHASGIFDLALAERLVSEDTDVVTNEFALSEDKRLIVVTGANQGGKTTFSRTFGQLHYLAALGLPVPGSDAELFLFDHLFTHYEKEEDVHTLHGKLEDELVRIHDILSQATSNSIIIMNEIFTSTTLEDAIVLGTAVINQIIERDILCVCVTFVDELSTLSDSTVSMVADVDPADPASRTFTLVPKPADGLAYAAAIANKYGLSYDRIKERIAS